MIAAFRRIVFIVLHFSATVGSDVKGCTHETFVFGVDYYPEHWPLEWMHDDMVAIKDDLGADIIRIGEFMWHELEPEDNVFNFTLLDRIVGVAEDVGLQVMLGTPTAAMPAWLHAKHPEVMLQGPDSPEGYAGTSPAFGGRRQYSFNSAEYAHYAARIVAALAKRYGSRKSITFWQVDNELGHENSDLDFSEQALNAWRKWLEQKYQGDNTRLNIAWGTAFWGVTYNNFDEIPLPRWTIPGSPSRPNENFRSNSNPGMLLDFRRFRRDSITAFAKMQVEVLRNASVHGCLTTNAPGGFWDKALDHNDIFAEMDVVAYDNYPVWGGSVAPTQPSEVALVLDTVRGWIPNSKHTGWMVAEQLIGAQGHDIIGYTPRPGQVTAWAASSLVHGATSISFFRYRAATFGQEQFCYGILDHTTPRGSGRKWTEVKKFYKLARSYERLWTAPVEAKVALLYDVENIFAWQAQPQSTVFNFATEAHRLYKPFWRNGATVDVISVKRILQTYKNATALFEQYRVLLLPALMLTSDALVELIENFVHEGGSLWVGFRSDLKDERSQMRQTPSRFAALAGVDIVEIESLNHNGTVPVQHNVRSSSKLPDAVVTVWREGLQVAKNSTAQSLWHYTDSFFGGQNYSAVTRLRAANGKTVSCEVVYIGAGIDPEALVSLATASLEAQQVAAAGVGSTPDVEQFLRKDLDGNVLRIAINHGSDVTPFLGTDQMSPFEVRVNNVSHQSVDPINLHFFRSQPLATAHAESHSFAVPFFCLLVIGTVGGLIFRKIVQGKHFMSGITMNGIATELMEYKAPDLMKN